MQYFALPCISQNNGNNLILLFQKIHATFPIYISYAPYIKIIMNITNSYGSPHAVLPEMHALGLATYMQ